jgi:hypothetical protein
VFSDDLNLFCPFGEIDMINGGCADLSKYAFPGPNGIDFANGYLIVSVKPSGFVYLSTTNEMDKGPVSIDFPPGFEAELVEGFSGDGISFLPNGRNLLSVGFHSIVYELRFSADYKTATLIRFINDENATYDTTLALAGDDILLIDSAGFSVGPKTVRIAREALA